MPRFFIHTALALATCAAAASSFAQTAIDQSRALAGGVTPGDAPGFPITISQPGHYVLRGALTVPDGPYGIEITAPNVTLDLGGFTITGSSTCTRNATTRVVSCTGTSSLKGVVVQTGAPGAVVRNGTVSGFGRGVQGMADAVFEDLRVSHNGTGIETYGADVTFRMSRVVATLNGGNGFVTWGSGIVEHSVATNNGTDGFYLGTNTSLQDSVSTGNRLYGARFGNLRGVRLNDNGGANRYAVTSMGNNLDDKTPF